MFVLYDKTKQRIPIKVWLDSRDSLDDKCLKQAYNLANLPFTVKHVALMPDTHTGYGMPIGGVIACKDIIIPHAVGNDIGCGMAFLQTDIPAEILMTKTSNGSLAQTIVGEIMRNVPLGFNHHKDKKTCQVLDNFEKQDNDPDELVNEIPRGCFQVGTLGGGNHFIELQEDENKMIGIMLHSGSRNFGTQICRYFNNKAKELNALWYSLVPKEQELAFLPVASEEGKAYIRWMNIALDFAMENRQQMLETVENILIKWVKRLTNQALQIPVRVNCHHNYAIIESHFGENLWVHRKGAIRARSGDTGIIPGSMGSYSYVVRGLGNPESFFSCSHGAGRSYSRKKAKEDFTVEAVMKDLKESNVVLGKSKKSDLAEECRFAYKDIDFVINQELDLVVPVKKLKTLAVVKG